MADKFLRWIWPKLSYCPECSCTYWSRSGAKGQIQYRQCTKCQHVYKVSPVAQEIDRGGRVSEVVLL